MSAAVIRINTVHSKKILGLVHCKKICDFNMSDKRVWKYRKWMFKTLRLSSRYSTLQLQTVINIVLNCKPNLILCIQCYVCTPYLWALIHVTFLWCYSYTYSNRYRFTVWCLLVMVIYPLPYCVVDGGWSTWVCGSCSKTCGNGTQSCTRSCNNPKPSCNGKMCSGLSAVHYVCNTQCCPSKFITVCLSVYM